MATQILNASNSFVTFYNLANDIGASNFITDTPCGIQQDFCYPINSVGDLAFQTYMTSDINLVANPPSVLRTTTAGSAVYQDVTVNVINLGAAQGGGNLFVIYCSFESSSFLDNLNDGDCFQVSLSADIESLVFFVQNQCFKYITDTCLTSLLWYKNDENAFGFIYAGSTVSWNKIRLPIYFKEPQIPSEKNVYIRSDGSRKLLSSRLSKKYKGMIDMVTEQVHQCLVVALNHDLTLWFTENNYSFYSRFEDEYNNEFPSIMQNVNVWPADFIIFETPFNNYNSNCV